MKKEHIAGIWAVALIILGVILYPYIRWGLFSIKVSERVQKVERYATAEEIIALPAALKEEAKRYRLDPATMQVAVNVEERAVMGAVAFWFVVVKVTDGTRSVSAEDRIESPMDDAFLEKLVAAGIGTSRAPKPDLGLPSGPSTTGADLGLPAPTGE